VAFNKLMQFCLLFLFLTFNADTALASSQVSGQLSSLYFTSGNYAFRVYIANTGSGCTDGFYSVDISNPSYNLMSSGLLSAYSLGKTVSLIYAPDTNGFCAISEFAVS
jgi:hypothetical protein